MAISWETTSLPSTPRFEPRTGAAVPVAGLGTKLLARAAAVASAAARVVRRARERSACVLWGHERWITLDANWSCMRCGRQKGPATVQFPGRPRR